MQHRTRPVLALLAALLLAAVATSGQAQPRVVLASSNFEPTTEQQLFANGYAANVVFTPDGRRVLRASQRNYSTTTWIRDLDYSINGYTYLLSDMSVYGENVQYFLDATGDDGVVPEYIDFTVGRGENRQAWDAQPNLISAAYAYAAKTGDRGFIAANIGKLERIAAWIELLDTDNDALPDRDIFPYGYYDTVENGVMHTYAIAKFYAAYRNMAELERWIGRDGSRYESLAARMRRSFHLPEKLGGYWRSDLAWPIAWRKADGRVFTMLETFGVLQAAHEGLIGPQDGWRYRDLFTALHNTRDSGIDTQSPSKLAIGGYPLSIKRTVQPVPPDWMLDAAAPWIIGLDVPERARAGYPEDAARFLAAYKGMVDRTGGTVLEFVADERAKYGPGDTGDRGRTWDTAAWFQAVYGGHYGIRMRPDALRIAPQPIATVDADGITDMFYQGANVSIVLDATNRGYLVVADRPIDVELWPVGDSATIAVDGVDMGYAARVRLQPDVPLRVQSAGTSRLRSDAAFAEVWRRADQPVARGESSRSWLWGPLPLRTTVEPYADSPDFERAVEYYDKARMEITQPGADRSRPWFITNGLLVKELVSGRLQLGDTLTEQRAPADVPIAGDPTDNSGPVYSSFGELVSLNNDRRAEPRIGDTVTATIDRWGTVGDDPALGRAEARIAVFDQNLGHNIPSIFWRYMEQQPDDWIFAFGYPISEPYWTTATVGAAERTVLVQLFERRVLTYTPGNPRGFEVEMGNVGQHYHRWRYGTAPWDAWGQ